ncbi:hypothetical protein CJ030_MR2G024113 [Morella rubra]|uniref:Uncharacterized protein n=1 Tax=Morella rubra TaxID=262757 RepID=A0A6A1WGT2_9ROSI|nr:hypothetical protein CJ030_MR2G024113 [Morella rubra]
MPANPAALHILHQRLNVYLSFKPFFLSLPHFSSPSLSFVHSRRFLRPRLPFPITPRNLSSLSSTSAAQSVGEDGGGGGRSGALSPPPITEDVQKIDVNPPKGTRDFPPEEMRLRNWLFHNFREGAKVKCRLFRCPTIPVSKKLMAELRFVMVPDGHCSLTDFKN